MHQHELKIWPPHFEHLRTGDRRFDVRRNDRRFLVGNVLKYREYVPAELGDEGYTGRHLYMRVRYMLNPVPGRDPDCGLVAGYVVLDLEMVQPAPMA